MLLCLLTLTLGNTHKDFCLQILLFESSKLEFYVTFNSQGHQGTGIQFCHLWGLEPHRQVTACDEMPNH